MPQYFGLIVAQGSRSICASKSVVRTKKRTQSLRMNFVRAGSARQLVAQDFSRENQWSPAFNTYNCSFICWLLAIFPFVSPFFTYFMNISFDNIGICCVKASWWASMNLQKSQLVNHFRFFHHTSIPFTFFSLLYCALCISQRNLHNSAVFSNHPRSSSSCTIVS